MRGRWTPTTACSAVARCSIAASRSGSTASLFLSKALAKLASKESCTITVLVEEAHDVTGSDPIRPEKAMIPARSRHPAGAPEVRLPRDRRPRDGGWHRRGSPPDSSARADAIAGRGRRGRQDRYRDTRGIPRHGPVGADIRAEPGADCLRPYACPAHLPDYWGSVESAARSPGTSPRGCARIALIGRSELPARDQWTSLIDTGDDETCARVEAVKALEALGTEVHVCR